MKKERKTIPNQDLAKKIVEDFTNQKVIKINRFSTGAAHYVYDVVTESGKEVVVRLTRNEQKHTFDSAVYWYDILKPKGVPLPDLFYRDLSGTEYGFPVLVMERLKGRDLGDEYPHLSNQEKEQIVQDIVKTQEIVGTLKPATGFGYAKSYNDPKLHNSWLGVLDDILKVVKNRNSKTKLIDRLLIQKLEDLITNQEDYFRNVRSTPFLDDTTTKNVIVYDGKLSGIVDVDNVCFGDPLLVVGLTQMALLEKDFDTYYTDYWIKLLNLSGAQKEIIIIYTALFCLEFISSMGYSFNREEPEEIDQKYLSHLKGIFHKLVS